MAQRPNPVINEESGQVEFANGVVTELALFTDSEDPILQLHTLGVTDDEIVFVYEFHPALAGDPD
jgi:hypothetical protein